MNKETMREFDACSVVLETDPRRREVFDLLGTYANADLLAEFLQRHADIQFASSLVRRFDDFAALARDLGYGNASEVLQRVATMSESDLLFLFWELRSNNESASPQSA